jgi:hypothetical protein
MSCELCRSELEDFLYGELSDARVSEIRAHLAGCRACASVRDDLKHENELFARYYEQTAIEPSAEMWEAVRERIRTEAAPLRNQETGRTGGGVQAWLFSSWLFSSWLFKSWLFRPAILRQAAFSLLLIALTVVVTTWVLKRERDKIDEKSDKVTVRVDDPTPAPATPTPQVMPPASRAPEAVPRVRPRVRRLTDQGMINLQIARAELEYRNAIRLLDGAIAKRKEGFDPELIRQYESSLALIDDSIAASRRALRERPNDLAAGQFLLAAYARKVELMQEFSMR